MEEIRFDIVIHTCLFLHVFFGTVWAPFWESLGTVLGRFWGRSGASWPLLGGLLALFLATLKVKRAQERPKRAQETPKRVQELDFGWLLGTCWAFFGSFWSFFFGPAGLDFLFFGSTLKRGGTCAAHPPPPEGMPSVPDTRYKCLTLPKKPFLIIKSLALKAYP